MSIGYNDFIKKGYGRIYVFDPTKIDQVKEIVKGVDAYEWGYYVKELIAPWEGKVELIYTHKFEPCIDIITLRCWDAGIPVWCISQHNEDFGTDKQEDEA